MDAVDAETIFRDLLYDDNFGFSVYSENILDENEK